MLHAFGDGDNHARLQLDGFLAPFLVPAATAHADEHLHRAVVDVMGRVVRCTDVARNVSTNGMTPGVYVLRLINGDNVRTQKMVIE